MGSRRERPVCPSPSCPRATGTPTWRSSGRPIRGRAHDRCYLEIIRCLVDQGIVVHSHFHRIAGVNLEPYERLADELGGGYVHEEKVPYRDGTRLSAIISRYDLMGVFHQLDATLNNESATLAVCMPTKAVCGWHHGAIPVVCFAHYRGLVELIESLGIGFVVDRLDEVGGIIADRSALERATAATLAVRERFTHEYQAARIADFYDRLRSRSGASG
jgi:glycosyltransferase involved in cell wall biosynthesis